MRKILFTLFLPLLLFAQPSHSLADGNSCVVLLHGIGRSKGSMSDMAQALQSSGYKTFNIGYKSRTKQIEDLAVDLHSELKKLKANNCTALHFVGHSMGGLLIRAYIHAYNPKNLGRVVMLGTPNRGSEVADLLHNLSSFKSFYGPAGQELVTDQTSFNHIFGKVNYDLGIIAGDRSIDPVSSLLFIPGKDDGKVAVERTKIDGMKDHIVLHVTHTFMPANAKVIEQTRTFLKNGRFVKNKVASENSTQK